MLDGRIPPWPSPNWKFSFEHLHLEQRPRHKDWCALHAEALLVQALTGVRTRETELPRPQGQETAL